MNLQNHEPLWVLLAPPLHLKCKLKPLKSLWLLIHDSNKKPPLTFDLENSHVCFGVKGKWGPRSRLLHGFQFHPPAP